MVAESYGTCAKLSAYKKHSGKLHTSMSTLFFRKIISSSTRSTRRAKRWIRMDHGSPSKWYPAMRWQTAMNQRGSKDSLDYEWFANTCSQMSSDQTATWQVIQLIIYKWGQDSVSALKPLVYLDPWCRRNNYWYIAKLIVPSVSKLSSQRFIECYLMPWAKR